MEQRAHEFVALRCEQRAGGGSSKGEAQKPTKKKKKIKKASENLATKREKKNWQQGVKNARSTMILEVEKKKKKKRHRLFSSERNRFIVGIRVQVAVAPPLTLGHSYFLVLAAWPSHTLAGSSALGGCAKLQSVEVYASGTTQR